VNKLKPALYVLVCILFTGVGISCSGEREKKTGETGSKTPHYVEGIHYLSGEPVRIAISDQKITAITAVPEPDTTPVFYVAPGLIDMQINGFSGVDFADQDLTREEVRIATAALWKAGITSFLPTLITADQEALKNSFSRFSKILEEEETGVSIPGFHLEGPYISPVKGFRGAHLEKYIREPDWEEFLELQQAAGNRIRLITVAPEMEGAIPFIRKCKESGVLVALGHHNGTTEQINRAVEAGASLSTHLGNGCANTIHRHHNPLWPQLANDDLSATLIVDGYHLNREEVLTFYRAKGKARTILVSDALDLAGLEPGTYTRWEREVVLTPHVVMFPAENVLAGAASPLSVCVGNMMRFTGCTLAEAIDMASTLPARKLGLTERGEIKAGKRADLILFSLEEGNMCIQKTLVAGKVVYVREDG
jgi:N-acetylglucosamine-6-phosphate deacetylase